jgi:hypothetical protein
MRFEPSLGRHRRRTAAPGHRRRRERAQGLVEFALVAPVLLLILLMAIDFGRALYGWVVLQNSARIAANFAALNAEAWRDNVATVKAEYQADILDDLQAANCDFPATLPDPQFTDGPDTAVAGGPSDSIYDVGDTVIVRLTCDFDLITPIVSAVLGNPVELGASSEFRIRTGDLVGLANPTRIPPPPLPPTPTPIPTVPVVTPPPTAPPTAPPCITVPDLVAEAGGPETVGQARDEWQAAGFTGSFSPNGRTNSIVLTQSIAAGQCVAPSSSISVTYL